MAHPSRLASRPAGRSDGQNGFLRALRGRRSAPERSRPKGFLLETVESIVFAVVIFLIVRTLAFQAFRIPSGSMEDTLLPGDFLFINKFAYGARIPWSHARLPGYSEPKRGDIIVFEFPQDPKQDYIKRCVAVAGDKVEVRQGQLLINDVVQQESYAVHKASHANPALDSFGPYRVPPGHLFMMGDNRDFSSDSRVWGPVDVRLIHGKAWVTYFSWDPNKHLPRPLRMFRLIH